MDSSGDSGVVETRERGLTERVIEAINGQVIPQIDNLTHGPLAIGAAQVLASAIQHQKQVAATVLQGTVMFDGKLYGLTFQIVATP